MLRRTGAHNYLKQGPAPHGHEMALQCAALQCTWQHCIAQAVDSITVYDSMQYNLAVLIVTAVASDRYETALYS